LPEIRKSANGVTGHVRGLETIKGIGPEDIDQESCWIRAPIPPLVGWSVEPGPAEAAVKLFV